MSGPAQHLRVQVDTHESFLRHRGYRWLKVALGGSLLAALVYMLHDPLPRPNGGSWYGYTVGTIGALLIVWLALLGVRKRRMTRGAWSLKGWTSAHVWLGLSLVVIGTLHGGFQFGWNVHTLAWGLMMAVILSGAFGAVVYATLPGRLSDNRAELTEAQMHAGLSDIDARLKAEAQPLDGNAAAIVLAATQEDPLGDGLWRRLSGRSVDGATEAAMAALRGEGALSDRIEALLFRRKAMLAQIRRHMHLRALLEIWLHLHVPLTFALIAALAAHVISVFFYW